MKIGVISDIHGNFPALTVALRALSSRRVSEVFCAGDLVGYYPFVNEVISELRRIGAVAVLGNHDQAVVSGIPIPESISATATAIHARKTIDSGNLKYLASLPTERRMKIEDKEIHVFHGTPASPVHGRVRSRADVEPALMRAAVAIGGHTHIPAVIPAGGALYVNPGSCGQPRDFDIRASCAVVDLETMTVEVVRELYDIDAVFQEMEALGFNSRIAWSLYAGEWVGSSILDPVSGMTWASGLAGEFDRREYRFCAHLRNRRSSGRYTCYIRDGRACLVTAPRYIEGALLRDGDSYGYKSRGGAVAACRVIEGAPRLTPVHFSEADAGILNLTRGSERET